MANLNNPSYTIERWHVVLVTYLIAMLAATVNILWSRFLNQISTFAVVWNILSFFVVVITILAANHHKQSASFVFSDFQNETGFSSGGMAVMIGLLQTLFGLFDDLTARRVLTPPAGMCCYDAPSHMTEEMLNPAKEAPQAIILSVYLGAVTGFVFLISAFFCIGDLEATATTPTGVPLIQIFLDSTSSVGGATTLAAMITVIVVICANSLMAEGSRALWAFSRDHGLPFSKIFAKVDKKSQVPTYSILLCMVLQMGLNSIYYGSFEGFSTVISIATFGFYLSYAAPLFVRLWSLVTHSNPSAVTISGQYSLGKYSPYINAVGLVFLIFAGIDFNFPQVGPVTGENMNYCSAAFGVIGLVSVVTWVFDGRTNFTGPQTPGIVNAIDAGTADKDLRVGGAAEKTASRAPCEGSVGDSSDEKAGDTEGKMA
ncbi:Choline transport protein [Cladophialophora carrionii]|uniref:Choline transport protein n=1 Tax=Cladophialophora carrionii TaxID=86049 RepID=A0A1C1CQE4_9EURO|nr:Choline transport protein [Cladophialophora carrionii]